MNQLKTGIMKTSRFSILLQTMRFVRLVIRCNIKNQPITPNIWVLTFIFVSAIVVLGTAQSADDTRAVLITGTSSGIGLKMTEVLSQNGFFVYAGVRNPEDYARLNAMDNVQAVTLDVTIQSEIDAAVQFIISEGRGLFGLINNAGVAVMGPLIELPEEDMNFQLDVNLFGPYRITKAFADLLIDSQGRVMTVSSIAGILSGQFMGAYSMSKHGVEAFTDALAGEMQRFNVEVAAVEPGNYKSQILASMVERFKKSGYTGEGSSYGSILDMIPGPLDRSQYQEPDDVASAALHFLTSERPKRRYMVVPNESEAEITIRQVLNELVQLNEGHQYSFSRDEIVEMLDQALANTPTSTPTSSSDPGLQQAAMTGNIQAIKKHIQEGTDLNEREPFGRSTALITASTFGHTDVARELIEAGAELDIQNNDGSTALLTAAFFCRTEIVEALLNAGADRSIRNNAGATALDVVVGPFEDVKNIYDLIGNMLSPMGLKLDYERIKATRPKIAEILQ